VYCFIPPDPEAFVTVVSDASGEKVIFTGSSAEPFLLVCNSAYSPDGYVTITDTSGEEEYWYPKLDEYLYVEQPRNTEVDSGALDISPYNEILLAYYEDMQANGDWEIPAKADLENTAWSWDGYTEGGNYYEYRVTFHADTADVKWNPGYGETTEYTDAQWEYKEDGVCVLTMDFGEFAGVRKYNLLIDWEESRMYIAADATEKELTWDTEPQYRFLLLDQTEGVQPMELVGTWERIRTEVDHVGNYGSTYALAIVDGQLVIRNYFEVDGAPGVSYETFQRVD
jgi:hypothetical protein